MSDDQFHSEFDSVLRYSKLRTADEIQPWIDKIASVQPGLKRGWSDHSGDWEGHSLVFADYLDDVEDPRADLIRKEVEDHHQQRAAGRTFMMGQTVTARNRRYQGERQIKLPDGTHITVTVQAEGSRGRKPRHVVIGWLGNTSDPVQGFYSQPDRTYTRGYPVGYEGLFTPQGAREWIDRLPEEHAAELHEFLDRHFGPRRA